MRNMILTAVMGTSLLVSACAENGQIDSQTLGPIMGGLAGGFLGSQFGEGSGKTAMAIGGALAGAWAGSKIAQGMSAQDRPYYDRAATTAATAPVGKTITWYSPDSGAQGTITPVRDGKASTGEYCREYQQSITVGGSTQKAYGTACRQPDGSWKIVQ
jgi:surface antigen